jgi:hypothetical protein
MFTDVPSLLVGIAAALAGSLAVAVAYTDRRKIITRIKPIPNLIKKLGSRAGRLDMWLEWKHGKEYRLVWQKVDNLSGELEDATEKWHQLEKAMTDSREKNDSPKALATGR